MTKYKVMIKDLKHDYTSRDETNKKTHKKM